MRQHACASNGIHFSSATRFYYSAQRASQMLGCIHAFSALCLNALSSGGAGKHCHARAAAHGNAELHTKAVFARSLSPLSAGKAAQACELPPQSQALYTLARLKQSQQIMVSCKGQGAHWQRRLHPLAALGLHHASELRRCVALRCARVRRIQTMRLMQRQHIHWCVGADAAIFAAALPANVNIVPGGVCRLDLGLSAKDDCDLCSRVRWWPNECYSTCKAGKGMECSCRQSGQRCEVLRPNVQET